MTAERRISYSDCLLNAALQLTSENGLTPTDALRARAAMAEGWLHLGEMLRPNGWVDLASKMVSLPGPGRS